MVDYVDTSRLEAQQLVDAISQLDTYLARGEFPPEASDSVGQLRRMATDTLIELRTGIEAYAQTDRTDELGIDPGLATQKLKLIRLVEHSKVGFELDVLPKLRMLVRSTIEECRHGPAHRVDTEQLQRVESNAQGWTMDRVLGSAEQLATQSDRVVGVVARVASLAHALGMLVSLVPA